MPVEFLTDEQAAAYGRFVEEPTRPELERFFFLDDVDRDLIALRRTKAHQLGFAVQMCTVRYVGRFLVDDPLDVPWSVVEHLGAQLRIEDPSVVKRYTERAKTAYEHAWEIRDAYGYHPFEDAEWGRKFRAFLHGRRGRALNVERLGALGEPKSLRWLRSITAAMLPKIDLPDLLFEVDSWTGFLDAFVHLGDGRTRMENLKTSLVALLVVEACKIGYTPVIDPDDEALTRGRLVHVDQYYLRADTIAAANAALIEAQGRVPIVEHWGEGLLASVDGLRFVVPKRTINAGPRRSTTTSSAASPG
ncbi:MAG: hypothetical protein DLM61_07680 [Pseudonocardiales bacterium]|nr:MAG: hypothetical protein DLM61_07680 [Pseudonocardiales bacterium]